MVRKHYDDFFPYNTALIRTSVDGPNMQQRTYLRIINIVHFVKNHEFDISNKICSLVQHASQNLSGHYQTSGLWVDLNISCQNSNGRWRKRLFKITEFLVGEGFDGRGIDCTVWNCLEQSLHTSGPSIPCHVFLSQCNSIFSYNSFACWSMRSDKNRVTHFEMIYCLFLESVQLEGILDAVKKSATYRPWERLKYSPCVPSLAQVRGSSS
jgi:hypothetical protein